MTSAPQFPAAGAAEGRSAAGRAKALPGTRTPKGDRRGPRPRLQHPPPPTLRAAGGERGPGPLATRQEVPRPALSMLSGVCARVWTPRCPWPLRPGRLALSAGGNAGRRPAPRAGGTTGPCSPGPERPPAASRSPWGPGPASLLPPHWPVAEPAQSAQDRGTPARPTPPA